MPIETLALLTAGILIVAFLYASVGHAGASGYIAVMSLASLAPAEIKPTALVLNILVASIGTWQFWRAGHFSWRMFWPFAVLSIPMKWRPIHPGRTHGVTSVIRCRSASGLPDRSAGRETPS